MHTLAIAALAMIIAPQMTSAAVVKATLVQPTISNPREHKLRQQFNQLALTGSSSFAMSLLADTNVETAVLAMLVHLSANIPIHVPEANNLYALATALKDELAQIKQDICSLPMDRCSVIDSEGTFVAKSEAWRTYLSKNNGSSHLLESIFIPFLDYTAKFKDDKAYRQVAKIRNEIRSSCKPTNEHWPQLLCVGSDDCPSESTMKTNSLTIECAETFLTRLMACIVFHGHLLRTVSEICRSHVANISENERAFFATNFQPLAESIERLYASTKTETIPSPTTESSGTLETTLPIGHGTSSAASPNICQTAACKNLAQLMLSQINASANPCDDFYTYACGSFVSRHPLSKAEMELQLQRQRLGYPERLPSNAAKEMLRHALSNQIRASIHDDFSSRDTTTRAEPDAVRHAKLFYDLCLQHRIRNSKQQRMAGVVRMVKEFTRWPFMSNNSLSAYEHASAVFGLLGRLKGWLNIEPMLGFTISSSRQHMITFAIYAVDFKKRGNLAQHDDFIRRTKIVNRILRILDGVAEISDDTERLRDTANQIATLELQLSTIASVLNATLASAVNISVMPLAQLYRDSTMLQPFLENAFRSESAGLSLLNENSTASVQIASQEYLEKIYQLAVNKTLRQTMLNMFMVGSVEQMAFMFDEDFNEPRLEIASAGGHQEDTAQNNQTNATNASASADASRACLQETEKYFLLAIQRLYAEKHFYKDKEDSIWNLIEQIKHSAERILRNSSVFTLDETKAGFLQRLQRIKFLIGCPRTLFNDSALNRWNPMRVAAKGDYFDTAMEFLKWNYATTGEAIPFAGQHCTMSVSEALPTYTAGKHTVAIPAYVSEYPMSDVSFPPAFQYGLMGWAFGHEIFHAFDVFSGIMTGNDSNARPNSSLFRSAEEERELEKRVACLREDANANFCLWFTSDSPTTSPTAKGAPSRGEFRAVLHATKAGNVSCVRDHQMGETMSDVNGLQAAFMALMTAWRTNSEDTDQKLPGLENYTMQQLFHIAFASFFCEPYNPLKLAFQLERDPHLPSRARVNVLARNSPAFATAFECKPGDRLWPPPDEVCQIY